MKGTVLIVDNEKSVYESLAKVLCNEGYEALVAADGIVAFGLYKQPLPDLVLLDLNMPQQNGWAAFEKIRKLNPHTPVIIITSRSDQSELAEVARFQALMEKPLDVPPLIEAVRQLIQEPVSKRLDRFAQGPASHKMETGEVRAFLRGCLKSPIRQLKLVGVGKR
jgi:CheY-like chemotaxis protein